ncbi:MAG: hypothetical protein LBG79_07900 [Spirochaetaceae bacterium]|jgi:hypothetical protein|nr:hypothetical protein [Spirochaetaceae bacterium]
MNKILLRLSGTWFAAAALFVFVCAALPAQSVKFSGIFDSKLTLNFKQDGEAAAGIEEFANFRLESGIKDKAVFFAAFNAIVLSGLMAESVQSGGGFVIGESYAAALELERLYFRANGGIFDVEAGLKRLAFGFGQVFAPSDFLNSRNPLFPDARPRAVLAGSCEFYPNDSIIIEPFVSTSKNPFYSNGTGAVAGISGIYNNSSAYMETFYAFEAGENSNNIHRVGFSFKTDIVIGFWVDALYLFVQQLNMNETGLSFSAGADYSFFNGKCYTLFEYMWSGSSSVTAKTKKNIYGFEGQNYLYGVFRFNFNDWTNASAACLAALDNFSCTPILSVEYGLFQGFTLVFQTQVSVAKESDAEFSPEKTKTLCTANIKARMRF